MFDLGPPATELARVVAGVRDDLLDSPTPCADYPLAALLDHVHGLAVGLTLAARKQEPPPGAGAPSGAASRLPGSWRTDIPARLDELVAAWADPQAWEGEATAGGVRLPAPEIAMVTVDELVLHGWDVARASDQPFDVDDISLTHAERFVAAFADPEMAQTRAGLFGPAVDVPAHAPRLDRLVALAGRDPGWSATR